MGNSIKRKIKLKDEHISFLAELPESGMGYQIVNVILKNGQHLMNRVVLNSEFLMLEDDEDLDPGMIERVEFRKKI